MWYRLVKANILIYRYFTNFDEVALKCYEFIQFVNYPTPRGWGSSQKRSIWKRYFKTFDTTYK